MTLDSPLNVVEFSSLAMISTLTLGLIIAVYFDVTSRKIPNWLILAGLIISFAYHTGYGSGFSFWGRGLFLGFVFFLPLYMIRTMGAGDVKLMALIGSFLGGSAAFHIAILTFISGGLLALLVMCKNKKWNLVFKNLRLIMLNLKINALLNQLPQSEMPVQSAGNLPYGVAIATGTLIYMCFFRP